MKLKNKVTPKLQMQIASQQKVEADLEKGENDMIIDDQPRVSFDPVLVEISQYNNNRQSYLSNFASENDKMIP